MKKLYVLMILLLVFPLSGCTNEKKEKQNDPIISDKSDFEKFKNEYEKLNPNEDEKGITVNIESDNIKYLTVEESIDFLKNNTGIIYFGFPSCPWCRNIVPILLEVGRKNNMIINYVDVSVKDGNEDFYNQLKTLLNDYLMENSDGVKTLYVPDVYFVKDGKIKGHHLGSASTQTNPYEVLTDEQVNELKKIYSDLINQIKE